MSLRGGSKLDANYGAKWVNFGCNYTVWDLKEKTVSATAAMGIGATVSTTRNEETGESTVGTQMAIGEGLGAFGGYEFTVATFQTSTFKSSFIKLSSADIKVGVGFAVGLRIDFDAAGQMQIKAFGGFGIGEKATVNVPVSLGAEIWNSLDK